MLHPLTIARQAAAKRAFDAMMEMKKIDIVMIEAAGYSHQWVFLQSPQAGRRILALGGKGQWMRRSPR